MSTNTPTQAASTIAAQKHEIEMLHKMVAELEAEKDKCEAIARAWRNECIRLLSGTGE